MQRVFFKAVTGYPYVIEVNNAQTETHFHRTNRKQLHILTITHRQQLVADSDVHK
jgi:hypothetical protein